MPLTTTLTDAGARFDDAGRVLDFGDAPAELAALQQGAVVSPLTQFGVIRFAGEDSTLFLNGQLSSDVRALAVTQAQYSSYSTPKGRMLASFLVLRDGDDYLLQLAAELLPAIQKRLSMYVLRSKTRASDASGEWLRLGVAGPEAPRLIERVVGSVPADDLAVLVGEALKVIRLPDARFEILATPAAAGALWQKLVDAGARPVGEPVWRLTDIRAGIAWVTSATQEDFVPQMANMELIGAVSFTKGCYPGQEIVARTQYLGKLKRRALRVEAAVAPSAGQEVYSPEMNGQASGKVVQAAPAPGGGYEALVVAQTSSLEHGLHLESPDGPALTLLPLPYSLDAATT
ncbi:CAF17-like 4Fe-4S cluster assembly/insertion protein YgfZ [Chitiniphilus eburneus]|uniref:Folate-binding protein YgfZ n=1 Tax=Chitiniphilus eburneus TaxID=2571148 RepID=A0A4U0PXR5_9NEIS|nr:folate-binding protein YgfZ [Chitiniphilus eburneus]TJZ73349.1 folate-binding protein YgfZ [Chitiniphilus eburneus]